MFTEKEAVEDYIVNRLQEMDWELKGAAELKKARGSYEEPLLIREFEALLREALSFYDGIENGGDR